MTTGLTIVGQNPPASDLQTALENNTARRIACQESRQRQFDPTSGNPIWNSLGDGGAGIMQITPPTPDQVWNWRLNVQAGLDKLNYGLGVGVRYPGRVEGSAAFQQLVTNYNNVLQVGLPPIKIHVPAFTSSGFDAAPSALGQEELNAIRVYNGVGGSTDGFGNPLMEFRVATTVVNGATVPQVTNIGAKSGDAVWQRVPATDRPQGIGDSDYVNHVLAQPTQCGP